MAIELGLLAAVTAMLLLFVWRDRYEYLEFQLLTRTADRQRSYRRWILISFFAFGVGALGGLVLLGRFDALIAFPAEFADLAADARRLLGETGLGAGFIAGAAGAIVAGVMIGVVLRKKQPGRVAGDPIMLGDIEPLLPRNPEERRWTTLLSLNAGFSEELFFRLFLPLLVVELTGNALLAFIIAAIVFGIAHLYQGGVGVIATIGVGAVMTIAYVASGTIWLAVVFHALIDLSGLVIRPWLRERAARQDGAAPPR